MIRTELRSPVVDSSPAGGGGAFAYQQKRLTVELRDAKASVLTTLTDRRAGSAGAVFHVARRLSSWLCLRVTAGVSLVCTWVERRRAPLPHQLPVYLRSCRWPFDVSPSSSFSLAPSEHRKYYLCLSLSRSK